MEITTSRPKLTVRDIYECRDQQPQRFGQAVVNRFHLKDDASFSSYADRLFHASNEVAEGIIRQMIEDLQIPEV